MNPTILRLYHHLPGQTRMLMASARGHYLRRWRYGPETERLVEEATARESWTGEQWRGYNEERLARILQRAATRVPHYREHWTRRRMKGDKSASDILANWPVLEKDDLRARPLAFVADDRNVRSMFRDHTSGTSGKSLDLWFSRETVREWYALFEARARRWYDVSRRDRWAIIGGQLVAPITATRPPFWVWNAGLKQLYMSAWHLAPRFIPHYLDALERHGIRYILGYSSALNTLGAEAARLGWEGAGLRVAITNAEPLPAEHRASIEAGLRCPVRETYGMAELVAVATECGRQQLHLWPEVGWLETIEGNQATTAGEPGDLICTGLLNADMPLIRYRVGDRATFGSSAERCECGRLLPLVHSIDGRSDDMVITRDGRRIGQLESIFRFNVPVREAQVVQESLDRLRVSVVPDGDFSAADEEAIRDRLRLRLGSMEIVLHRVDHIPRTSNGKFRYVICLLTAEERATAEAARS